MRKFWNRMRTRNNEGGFTLIEAIIGMFVFTIGILAAASMQIGAIQGNDISRSLTMGANLAANQVEELRLLDYMKDADLSQGAHGPIQNGRYTLNYVVQRDAILRNTMLVNVTVTWNYKNTPKSLDIVYIKHDTI